MKNETINNILGVMFIAICVMTTLLCITLAVGIYEHAAQAPTAEQLSAQRDSTIKYMRLYRDQLQETAKYQRMFLDAVE